MINNIYIHELEIRILFFLFHQPAEEGEGGTLGIFRSFVLVDSGILRIDVKGALSRILTDFQTAKMCICGVGNRKIMGHFY